MKVVRASILCSSLLLLLISFVGTIDGQLDATQNETMYLLRSSWNVGVLWTFSADPCGRHPWNDFLNGRRR
jgi:hypothetical protein